MDGWVNVRSHWMGMSVLLSGVWNGGWMDGGFESLSM